ncbi:TonB-dependent receptor [Olivibacter sp. SDN3]|uniref:TonB-dependent receptor n=1 Tax=Olivibacter sp. SDN3 TaxID=2764720 RepID=UPI00165101D7|nr:TonB-dependent receptor [Olivibacter sp. SDN3]QNL49281.1 TonB-dependent receptor [Olivibacter sp. SDN3]
MQKKWTKHRYLYLYFSRTFLILCLFLHVELHAISLFAQHKLTIKGEGMTFNQLFQSIKKQTGLTVFYGNQLLDDNEKITVNYRNASLEEVLEPLLKQKGIGYEIRRDKVIVLRPARKKNVTEQISDRQSAVTGRVVDELGEALPGVSVAVKGSPGTGTVTDQQGNYSLKASSTAILVFTYTGYGKQEISLDNRSVLEVTLLPEEAALDEVVVVGYGTVRKGDLTGSVSSVKSDDITALPSINAMQSLTGRSAGVQVIQGSGAPGSGINVRIRGGNSLLGSNEPLYVVDGFAISGSPTILDPADIESMEVLKDASATAIYGSRGANGVVIITTKSGKQDVNQVSFNSYVGFQNVIKKLDMLNARQFAELANERASNDGVSPYFSADEVAGFGEGTDWQDAIFRTAPIQNHSLNVAGGNERTRYSVSGSYFGQDGIVINSGYKRGSIRSNLEQQVSEKFKVNLSTILSRTINNALTNDNQSRGSGVVSAALVAPPTIPVYDENGNYSNVVPYSFSSNAAENPVALAYERLNRTTGSGVLSNLALSYTFIEGLTLRVSAGIDYANSKRDYYSSRLIRSTPAGNATTEYSTRTNFLNENILNYNKSFGEHQLDLTGGITYQSEVTQGNIQSASGFTTDVLKNNNLQAATVIGTPEASVNEWKLLSGLLRANYTLQDRYLFTASIRADGSSRFGTTNQWGYFPSAAFAWRVNQEDFLKDVNSISNLKFRASWGQSGNTAIDPYGSLNVLSGFNIILGDNLYTGFAPQDIRPNPDLKWETTTQTNIGFDLGVWNERLRLTADYYIKNTRDLLASVPQPTSTGYLSQYQNIGSIRNQGLEIELGADIFRGNFRWDASFNMAANRNKVLELANHADVFGQSLSIPLSVSPNLVREGHPVGVFFGFLEDGLNSEGRIQYRDLDGNGVINNLDRTIIGNPNPDFIFGFNNNFSYKNFTLNVFLQGVQGLDIFNFNLSNHANAFNFGENQTVASLDRWTADNQNSTAANPMVSVGSSFRESDRFIENGSFIRLKNIRLGYDLPVSNLNLFKSLQVYVSGQNLWTITDYSWYDPEVSTRTGQSATTLGIDQSSYPVAKTYTVGLQANF